MGKILDFVLRKRATPIFHKHPRFSPLFGVSDRHAIHCLYTPDNAVGPTHVLVLHSDGRAAAHDLSNDRSFVLSLDPVHTPDGPYYDPAERDVLQLGHDLFGLTWPQEQGVVMTEKGYRQFVTDNIDYGSTMETVQ